MEHREWGDALVLDPLIIEDSDSESVAMIGEADETDEIDVRIAKPCRKPGTLSNSHPCIKAMMLEALMMVVNQNAS